MIRLQRIGRTNDPSFRLVVLEKARAAKSNRILEQVGTYNPRTKAFAANIERIKARKAQGAQLSPSLMNLLIEKGLMEGKKTNVLPKKTKQVKKEVVPAAPAATFAPSTNASSEAGAAGATDSPAESVLPADEAVVVGALHTDAVPAEEKKEEAPVA